MSDLISRQDAINCCSCLHPEDCWDEIRKLPSADIPTGEWVKKALLKDTVYDLHVYKCSCCGVWGKLKFNYCPNCGARMYKGGTE